MKKRLFLFLVLTIVVNSSLLAQGLNFQKPQNNLFEIENIDEVSAQHKKIAVLPFRTLIVYQHPDVRAESQLEQVKNLIL